MTLTIYYTVSTSPYLAQMNTPLTIAVRADRNNLDIPVKTYLQFI